MTSFNPAVTALDVPPIPLAASWSDNYNGAHGPLINLSQAVPDFSPHENLMRDLSMAALSPESTGYGPIEGETSLREVYAEKVARRYSTQLGPENIHITSGCNQAFVTSLMAVAGHGDTVLMTNPCYFNHEATASLLGIKLRYVDCMPENGFQPDVDSLEAAMDNNVKAIALVSPNNPTGAIYSPEILDRILSLCEKHRIWLILDETYRDFLPKSQPVPHRLLQSNSWQDHFIQLYSFSKSLCIPGHRLGAITAGPEAVRQIAKVMDNIQICAPRAAQIAVAKQLPLLDQWTAGNTKTIHQRAKVFKETMACVPNWKILSMGAYFAYVEHPFSEITSADLIKTMSAEYGILPLPGSFFGRKQSRYLRVAFANVDSSTLTLLGDRVNTAEDHISQMTSQPA